MTTKFMCQQLIALANYLNQNGLEKEAALIINSLTEQSKPQKAKEYQKPTDLRPLHALLKSLGLVPGPGNGIDLVNAALYLAEGVTSANLLLSAISITSLVPGLDSVSKLIKHGSNLDSEATVALAKLILQHKERIKFSFDKLKDKSYFNYLENLVPQGRLLPSYADRMFEEMRRWAFNIVNSGVKSKTDSQVTETQQAPDALIDQSLIGLL